GAPAVQARPREPVLRWAARAAPGRACLARPGRAMTLVAEVGRVVADVDWVTISSLATAGGTLVLAIATFASVRSANRAARTAERSLLEGLRPVLVTSRLQDPPEKIVFVDEHWVQVPGGYGSA